MSYDKKLAEVEARIAWLTVSDEALVERVLERRQRHIELLHDARDSQTSRVAALEAICQKANLNLTLARETTGVMGALNKINSKVYKFDKAHWNMLEKSITPVERIAKHKVMGVPFLGAIIMVATMTASGLAAAIISTSYALSGAPFRIKDEDPVKLAQQEVDEATAALEHAKKQTDAVDAQLLASESRQDARVSAAQIRRLRHEYERELTVLNTQSTELKTKLEAVRPSVRRQARSSDADEAAQPAAPRLR